MKLATIPRRRQTETLDKQEFYDDHLLWKVIRYNKNTVIIFSKVLSFIWQYDRNFRSYECMNI